MKRFVVTLMVLVLILAGQVVAGPVTCVGDTLVVRLEPGDPGMELKSSDFGGLSPAFQAAVDSANAYRCRLLVEVSNDSTKWRLLRILRQDPNFSSLNYPRLNLVLDAALNYARRQKVIQILSWVGVSSDALVDDRPMRDKTCFLRIYPAPLLPYQQQPVRVLEKIVPEVKTTTIVERGVPSLAMRAHFGLTTTGEHFSPLAAVSLNWREASLCAYGLHSLWLRYDREVYGIDQSSYDQGAGLLMGLRIGRQLLLSGGYHHEESVLATNGCNSRWYRGGQLGLTYEIGGVPISASVFCLYGQVKDAGEFQDEFSARAALVYKFWEVR